MLSIASPLQTHYNLTKFLRVWPMLKFQQDARFGLTGHQTESSDQRWSFECQADIHSLCWMSLSESRAPQGFLQSLELVGVCRHFKLPLRSTRAGAFWNGMTLSLQPWTFLSVRVQPSPTLGSIFNPLLSNATGIDRADAICPMLCYSRPGEETLYKILMY